MSNKEDGDPAAVALVKKRWDKATDQEKKAVAEKMNAARWAGHIAKRPTITTAPPKKKRGRSL